MVILSRCSVIYYILRSHTKEMIDSVEVISCRWYTLLYTNWSKPQTSDGSTKKPKMTKFTFLVNKYVRSSILRKEIINGKAEEIHHFFLWVSISLRVRSIAARLKLKDKYNYFLLLLHYSTTVPPISRELSMKNLRRNWI